MFYMEKKRIIEILLLSIFGAIMILPGFFFWDIAGHELYHAYKHNPYVERICVNYNYPYASHVLVDFPDQESRKNYNAEAEAREEITANKVGRIISLTYIVLILALLIWAINFVKRVDEGR